MAVDWGTIVGAIAAYLGSKNANKNGGGKFTQIPEDPTQKALREKELGFIDNSPTRNLFGGLINSQLANNQGWTPPPSKYGYGLEPTPKPKYDLSKILPNLNNVTPPRTDKPEGGGPATGTPLGAVHGGPQIPTFIQDDPGTYSSGGPMDGESIYSFLTRNPGGDPRAFLPNNGQSAPNPNGTPAPNTPQNGTPSNPHEFDALNSFFASESNTNSPDFLNRVTQYLNDHPKMLPTLGSIFGVPGLAAGGAAQLLVNWWNKNHQPPPTSGFIPGSITGKPTPPPPGGP